jgi:hypothetical protein
MPFITTEPQNGEIVGLVLWKDRRSGIVEASPPGILFGHEMPPPTQRRLFPFQYAGGQSRQGLFDRQKGRDFACEEPVITRRFRRINISSAELR